MELDTISFTYGHLRFVRGHVTANGLGIAEHILLDGNSGYWIFKMHGMDALFCPGPTGRFLNFTTLEAAEEAREIMNSMYVSIERISEYRHDMDQVILVAAQLAVERMLELAESDPLKEFSSMMSAFADAFRQRDSEGRQN